jgi:glucosyl-dolichyl phosphate glucuronosyltransferase
VTSPMKITVILCTCNRCQSLAKALESIAASELPASVDWDVLVVDNNSSDQTRQVVEDFCQRYPGRFRYLFEPEQGKSSALNAGIRTAHGDILAFTDDDVTVEATWLQNLTVSLRNEEWAGAAGRVLPDQSFSPPLWLACEGRYSLGPLALFDLGPDAQELTEPPFGNNMAFKRALFEKYGGFQTDLGPRFSNQDPRKVGEDSEFSVRLLAAGERLWYEPSAIVYHAVPASRIQKDHFLEWWFDKSRSQIRAFGIPHDTKLYLAGIPLYLFRRLAVWTLRWMVGISPSRRFSSKLSVWRVAGAIQECYRQSRSRRELPPQNDC